MKLLKIQSAVISSMQKHAHCAKHRDLYWHLAILSNAKPDLNYTEEITASNSSVGSCLNVGNLSKHCMLEDVIFGWHPNY